MFIALNLGIDECASSLDDCAQICTNPAGSYKCSCFNGYNISSDGRSCLEVIDECNLGMHNCQQLCVNILGGFRCTCNPGYQLNSDQITCEGWLIYFVYIACTVN